MPISSTCYHEAGHAVAYLAAGRRWAQVLELTVDGEIGHCRVRRRRPDPIAALCGYASEYRARFGPGWHPTKPALRLHMHLADFRAAADALGTDDVAALLAAWNAAATLVDLKWSLVALLAETLQRTGRLTGEDVEMIAGQR